jgi:AraC family transcriptional regulator of adaptative response / DNA-3-methyladenine glycosylase II
MVASLSQIRGLRRSGLDVHVRFRPVIEARRCHHSFMAPDHDACYRAVTARDARFDGRFCTAVLTTGIFCRPSCPARTPHAKNVVFYPGPAAAREAGFRPCKRCRPELAPGHPEWDRRADVVGRALRLIGEGAVADDGVPGLATRLSVSERHLRRLFVEELGAGPLQVVAARRLGLARLLVDQTTLPLTEVAFAAGFASIRRFNAAMAEAFGAPPRELRATADRRRRGISTAEPDAPVDITVHLPARQPYAHAFVRRFLERHPTPGVEAIDDRGTWHRTVANGIVSVDVLANGLDVRLRVDDVACVAPLIERVRRMFDLDADPTSIADVLGLDPVLSDALAKTPGIRLPGTLDPFATTVGIILGQQVSLAGAATLLGRLVQLCGEKLDVPAGPLTHRSPTAAAVAAADLSAIGLTGARQRALAAVATAVASGAIDLEPGADRERSIARLADLPGIGPWTTALIASRALGDPDALPASDLILRRITGLDARARGARSERWRPWRSYATFALWSTIL